MKKTIECKYLIFPVNTLSDPKKLTFSRDGKTVYELDIRLDSISPDFYAHIDVSRFMGQALEISVSPQMPISFTDADDFIYDDIYSEPYRPHIHFTAKNGWLNDPNGLVYFNGKYHMFFQHNPAENRWGNMHWGHAVSTDLLHWEEKDIALFPDDNGMMFSGSALVDKDNLLGLKNSENPAVLFYYTATKPFAQYIAYSTDGMKTLNKLGNTPVIPNVEGDNRDPKVIWCEEIGAYILALFFGEDRFGLFRSDDLKNWELFQQISLEGDRECPDIFPLCDKQGKRKWIIIGAHDKYLVGDFKNGLFLPTQGIHSLHYGKSSYAGQCFSNMPRGRIVRINWDKWYANTPRIKGQMGFPTEMTLLGTEGEHYLSAKPIGEIESLYEKNEYFKEYTFKAGDKRSIPLEKKPYHIKLSASRAGGSVKLTLFGRPIELDLSRNTMKASDIIAPLSVDGGGFDMEIISDSCSIELYLDGGRIYFTAIDDNTIADYGLPHIDIESSEDITLDIELHSLASVLKK